MFLHCPLVALPTQCINHQTKNILRCTSWLFNKISAFEMSSLRVIRVNGFLKKWFWIGLHCVQIKSKINPMTYEYTGAKGQVELYVFQEECTQRRSFSLCSILGSLYYYLILFPQHWKLVVIDGWFHHLHIQVINAEIEIPKPEHHTVRKESFLKFKQMQVRKCFCNTDCKSKLIPFPLKKASLGLFVADHIRLQTFCQIYFTASQINV